MPTHKEEQNFSYEDNFFRRKYTTHIFKTEYVQTPMNRLLDTDIEILTNVGTQSKK